MLTLFYFIVFIFSAVIHEISHGYAAKALGDDTAERSGRLTLNPVSHLDLFGSVILPLMFYLTSKLAGGFGIILGWAKPVPYNPFNLKNPKKGALLIALAGPMSNFSLALLLSSLFRLGLIGFNSALGELLAIIILINLMLGIFNLVPIPPLDGSKVLFGLLPASWYKLEEFLNQYSLIIFLMFLFWGIGIVGFLVGWLFQLLTGIGLGV
ncbi:MAG: site-2 protease family protein [Patescibacteria group bacterium]